MLESLWQRSQVQATANNLSPVLSICSVLGATCALAAFLGRMIAKLLVVRKQTSDDWSLIVAMVFAIAQSVLVVVAAKNGLGRPSTEVTQSQLIIIDKTMFAASLCFVGTLVLIKISVGLLIYTIVPIKVHQRIAVTYNIAVALWGVSSLLGGALACGVDSPWLLDETICLGKTLGFWNTFNILNLLTDIFLIIWPILIFRSIRTTVKNRLYVIACFSTRIIAVAATVVQLVYLNRSWAAPDRTFAVWPLTIATQAVQALSVITACIPTLRPFLAHADSGMIRSDDFRRRRQDGFQYHYGASTQARKSSIVSRSFFSRKASALTVDIPLVASTPASNDFTKPEETVATPDIASTTTGHSPVEYTNLP